MYTYTYENKKKSQRTGKNLKKDPENKNTEASSQKNKSKEIKTIKRQQKLNKH